MDRNSETRYGEIAQIEKPRSTWQRSYDHKTTFNVGDIVPFYLDMDIIPGTTIKNSTSMVIRLNTPLNPTMDNLYIDTYYFKCSKFWYWDHWKDMMGCNEYGNWTNLVSYQCPMIETDGTEGPKDLACYFGVRQGIAGQKFSKIAVNAYCDIYNQWFRDNNVTPPIIIDKTDSDLTADGTINTGFGLLKASKFHDYFTSCLPGPQRGQPVTMPLGTTAPVVGPSALKFITDINSTPKEMYYNTFTRNTNNTVGTNSSTDRIIQMSSVGLADQSISGAHPLTYAGGLEVDLTNAVAATINAQRLAWATQRILERDAVSGVYYKNLLESHFGSVASDESLLRPEYLGGRREPINISQVLQQSSTDSTSPLGYTGAVTLTAINNEDFTKSFTKDDILMGILVVRADHSYQQGLPRQLTRKERLDHYWPELAHIGNTPVYNYEIFSQGPSVVDANGNIVDNQVFGYKEAWQEYMYKNNMITGELNSDYAQSLDVWHYGDDYASLPVLSQSWIEEPVTFVDRTIAVQSSTHHQFMADIYIQQTVTAPIPIYRTPGLVDHF